MFEYHKAIVSLQERLIKTNKEALQKAIDLFAEAIIKDNIVHTFGTGHSHMIGLELFVRAGGLANVNAFLDSMVMTAEGAQRSAEIERIEGFAKIIWDQHTINNQDIFIIISNSGRNAMPLEMAMLAKNNGNKVIVITSLEQSKKYPSRHSSQKKLFQLGDVVIDNCVPSGDGLLNIGGNLTGAASTISGCFMVNLIATEAMKIAHQNNVKLPIYHSQNIDGYSNEELYELYKNRVKHL
jgi:uncharacterized phosphosugar-binding protein